MMPNITNGEINAPGGTNYGDVALVSCDEGYLLNGSALLVCENGGVWTSLPTCVIKGVIFFTTIMHTQYLSLRFKAQRQILGY